MTFDEYQAESDRTTSGKMDLTVCALGICGEGGEVADHLKKHLAQGHDLYTIKVAYELGDVLWYVAQAARVIGTSLDEVARLNVEKLRLRYPDGFDSERSRKREGGEG